MNPDPVFGLLIPPPVTAVDFIHPSGGRLDDESFERLHNHRRFETLPELRGLRHGLQRRLYMEASKASDKGCFVRLLRAGAYGVVGVLLLLLLFSISKSFFGSRFNPGFPFICIFAPLVVVLSLVMQALDEMLKHRRMRRYLWRRIKWMCSTCGYDLTGNESGRCPECGRERDE